MTYAATELRLIRARLAAVVLLVEDRDASLNREAAAELKRIAEYVERIRKAALEAVRREREARV